MKLKLFLIFGISAFFISCTSIPESGTFQTKKIATAFGPEDIVLDSISVENTTRLLLSCATRRDSDSITNGIYWMDLSNDEVFEFERINEPPSFKLNPHGFDLVLIDSIPYLFVISHDDVLNVHPIVKYKVQEKSLVFQAAFHNTQFFISPNDVFALSDGSFFITNDAGKRNSLIEKIFKLKRSSVVYKPLRANAYFIDQELSYANGIYFDEPNLYVSTVLQNTIFKFTLKDFKPTDKQILTEVIGGDNITRYKDKYIVAAHLNFFAFLKHKSKSTNLSPTVIYQFDPITGEKEVLFSDDGSLISAASTAIRFGDYLYVSQIFDNFILKVKLD